MTHKWRFLLIEDKDDIAQQVQEAADTFVDAPDTAVVERESSFKNGIARLRRDRFDLLILDLKDDQNRELDEHDVSAGLKIFDALKTIRFAPVVFYTAHAHKVRDLISPFVRVVEKSDGLENLGAEIRNVMATGLPNLSQLIDNIQRDYMWDFVSKHWTEFDTPHHKTDVAYLMARRLAATLELQAAALAQQVSKEEIGKTVAGLDVHPMQMYVYPTVEQLQAGDIVKGKLGEVEGMWIVLTPTCDFVQLNAEKILLARCNPLTETNEYIAWAKDPSVQQVKRLHDLVRDSRQKVQRDRFKYLPGTFFLEDSVVDLQDIATVPLAEVTALTRVACLDSPFAEALLGRFSRYFSRLGTPDVSKSAIFGRLETMRKALTSSSEMV